MKNMRYIISFSVILLFVYFYNPLVDYFFETTGIPSLNYGKHIDEAESLIYSIDEYLKKENISFESVSRTQTYPWTYLSCSTNGEIHFSDAQIENLKKLVPQNSPCTRIYLFLYNNGKQYYVLRLK